MQPLRPPVWAGPAIICNEPTLRPLPLEPDPMPRTPELLPFTGIPEADRLIAQDALALLIGFELDQQVTLQKAFSGPWEIQQRIGHLDAARIAATDPEQLANAFRQRPAIHRFPGSM